MIDDKEKPKSFVMYESYYNSIISLENNENNNQLAYQLFKVIMEYCLFDIEPKDELIDKYVLSIFRAMQFNMDYAKNRRKIAIANGKKGKGIKHTKQTKANESKIKQNENDNFNIFEDSNEKKEFF